MFIIYLLYFADDDGDDDMKDDTKENDDNDDLRARAEEFSRKCQQHMKYAVDEAVISSKCKEVQPLFPDLSKEGVRFASAFMLIISGLQNMGKDNNSLLQPVAYDFHHGRQFVAEQQQQQQQQQEEWKPDFRTGSDHCFEITVAKLNYLCYLYLSNTTNKFLYI